MLKQFDDLMVKILLAAAAISTALGFSEMADNEGGFVFSLAPLVEPFVIMVILVINAIVGVLQESNAEEAIEKLKQMQAPPCVVVRDGAERTIDAKELVPGDVVHLRIGDAVPADCRLVNVTARSIATDQAALTGETDAVEKHTDVVSDPHVLQDKTNALFTSTLVVRGSGFAVVCTTGEATEFGKIYKSIAETEEETTPLQAKLDEFGEQLGKVILWICIAVWAINLPHFNDEKMFKGNIAKGAIYYFKIAISLAVAAIPEGLPAVVTTCLALGTQRMAKKNAIVRTLPSVETLGCCTVICSDKTGTLTTNKMVARRLLTLGAGKKPVEHDVSGPPDFTPDGALVGAGGGAEVAFGAGGAAVQRCVRVAAIANDAKLVWDAEAQAFGRIGESTEAALRVLVEKAGFGADAQRPASLAARASFTTDRVLKGAQVTGTCEFSRDRKSMSRLVNGKELCVKGAPELLLPRCDRALLGDGSVVALDAAVRKTLDAELESFASQALRVLALAYDDDKRGDFDAVRSPAEVLAYESKLVFCGLAAMLDPPRDEVLDSIVTCRGAGIRVVVITGDNQMTAESICKKIGVFDPTETDLGKRGKSFIGKEFMALPADAKLRAVRGANLFARVEPAHKEEIVRILQEQGEVCAMTGDGVNDAPALKKAKIGIAMGITGTDVAKGAADMILADDNFATIVSAVEEGRIMYINTKQFIRFLVSSNIGEVVSIFLAAALGLPEGFVPVQLLWVNLVTDGPPATALGWNPTDDDIMRRPPRKSDDAIIDRFQFLRYATIGMYVGAATVYGFTWYYTSYSKGPHITYAQLARFHACDASWGLGDCDALFKQGPDGHWAGGATMSLTILVCIEMFNALNSVSESQSMLTVSPLQNVWLILAVLLSVVLHAVILYVPSANPIFYVKPLDLESWIVVLQICAPVCVLDELFKAYARATEAKAKAD